jgi:hypothetical protein
MQAVECGVFCCIEVLKVWWAVGLGELLPAAAAAAAGLVDSADDLSAREGDYHQPAPLSADSSMLEGHVMGHVKAMILSCRQVVRWLTSGSSQPAEP